MNHQFKGVRPDTIYVDAASASPHNPSVFEDWLAGRDPRRLRNIGGTMGGIPRSSTAFESYPMMPPTKIQRILNFCQKSFAWTSFGFSLFLLGNFAYLVLSGKGKEARIRSLVTSGAVEINDESKIPMELKGVVEESLEKELKSKVTTSIPN